MAVIYLMTADKDTNCGYIHCEDVSTFGAAYPDRRIDFADAWFVFEDGSAYLQDLSNEPEIDVPVTNNHTYTIYGFLVPVWVSGWWFAGAIVFHVDTFYINDSGGINNLEPGTSGSGWTVLTTSDFLDFYNCNLIQMQDDTVVINCPDYSVVKQECYIHRICDNSGTSNNKIVNVMDYELNIILTTTIDPATSLCYDLTLTGQGVYIVDIREDLGSGLYGDPQYLVIYEFCALENCAWYTIDKILCSADPCAEVCNPCDPVKINQQLQDRYTINMLVAEFGSLLAMIHTDMVKYMGIFVYDTDRQAFVTKIGLQLKKVDLLSRRCGICNDQLNDIPVTTNTTFNAVIQTGSTSQGCADCGG